MAFGDWELFRMVVVSLRELELSSFSTHEEGPRSVRFTVGSEQIQRKGTHNSFLLTLEIMKIKYIQKPNLLTYFRPCFAM